MIEKRIHKFNEKNIGKGPIVLKLSRDLRVDWNYALNYAIEMANKSDTYLIISVIAEDYFLTTDRRSQFFIQGLSEFMDKVDDLSVTINFQIDTDSFLNFVDDLQPAVIITDFYPLNSVVESNRQIAKSVNCSFIEIDSHNIVPARYASNKEEFAAYTIRPKINKMLDDFLVQIDSPNKVSVIAPEEFATDINTIEKSINELNKENIGKSKFDGGETNAQKIFDYFKIEKLNNYAKLRNDPANDYLSDLSPYFNFGFISAQQVAYEIKHNYPDSEDKDSFLEEMIIRRELSDNFCLYNSNYDNFKAFRSWAQETLNNHRDDKREYIYNLEDFELAKTHDKYWNAAQIQLIVEGKLHGYMRMYWAKKILEWTDTPETAHDIAIYLNDKYEIDGYDPNGYVGIAWSIGGIHDRAWTERKVFGKIRFMNANGLKRKFEIEKYASKYIEQNGTLF